MARVKKTSSEIGKTLLDSVQQIVADKGFNKDEVFSIVEAGMIAAYRKIYKTIENIRVEVDKESESIEVIASRKVVDNVILPGMEISFADAQKIKPDVQLEEYIDIVESPDNFTRVAAKSALQVVTQRLKILESNRIREEFSEKIGELSNGFILRKRNETVYVDLGKVEAIMPVKHQIPGEKYRVEDKVKVLIHSIGEEFRGSDVKIIVSRADKKFVQKLFEMEVPEIYDGVVEIKNIARLVGIRSKVVVHSVRSDVDATGACVGVRGVRIQAIVRELSNERVDIVQYSEDDREFVRNALSPAKPETIKIDREKKEALAIVADKDYSISIGKEGSNVKLASVLTGYRIDVKTQSQFSEEMSSPAAKKRLDELFSAEVSKNQEEAEEEEAGLSLDELAGLSKRVIDILESNGIHYLEQLIEWNTDDLANLDGIGNTMALRIRQLVAEGIDFEDDDDDDDELQEEEEIEENENTENKGEQEAE